MFIRNQRGVALVVALMITVIIGIIAVTLAGVTSKSQKSDNSYYGRALGSNSAISGVNRAINFLSATSNVKEQYLKLCGAFWLFYHLEQRIFPYYH